MLEDSVIMLSVLRENNFEPIFIYLGKLFLYEGNWKTFTDTPALKYITQLSSLKALLSTAAKE